MAIHLLSFPNCLCFLMILTVIVHIFTRDGTTRVVPETQGDLEVVFCKFPQTQNQEATKRCSSVLSVFILLENGCSYHKKSKVIDQVNDGTEEEEFKDGYKGDIIMEKSPYEGNLWVDDNGRSYEKAKYKKDEDRKSSSLVDWFVVCLLVFSAGMSLKEWYKEKNRKAEQQVGGEGQPPGERENMAAAGNRRFSLAVLTVNRHIRRKETQHQQQNVRKTSTSALVKTGSKPPPLLRRSSFPTQFPEVRTRQAPQRQQSHPGVPPSRRLSVDLTEDDSSPDRRRVRIIRRH